MKTHLTYVVHNLCKEFNTLNHYSALTHACLYHIFKPCVCFPTYTIAQKTWQLNWLWEQNQKKEYNDSVWMIYANYLFVCILDTLFCYKSWKTFLNQCIYPHVSLVSKSSQNTLQNLSISCIENFSLRDESTDFISLWPFPLLHSVTSTHYHLNMAQKAADKIPCPCT